MVLRKWKIFREKMERYLKLVSEQETWRVNFLQNKYHIIGIDQSRQMLAVAKENLYAEAVCVENGRIQAVGTQMM